MEKADIAAVLDEIATLLELTGENPFKIRAYSGGARILDNLIAQKRIPALIMVQIANGGGDAQGHERGKEYDTMSGLFAEYIQHEVLPLVEKNYGVKFTTDPDGRATMGTSSGGSAALIMAWYHPEWFRRVLTLSGTFVNQQWPFDLARRFVIQAEIEHAAPGIDRYGKGR